jgi:uncharacterized integral membrane protein
VNDDRRSADRTERSQVARLVVIAIIVIIVLAVVLDNRDDVGIGYVFGDVSAPLWLVLLIAGAAGVLVGWLLKHRPHRR